jgi:Chitobiase/beta-hexosaminidase C-terminal domain
VLYLSDEIEAFMKVNIPIVFFAGALACGQIAASQAISQGVLLNQQSMQNAGKATVQPPQVMKPGTNQTVEPGAPPANYDPSTSQRSFGDPGRSLPPYLSEYPGYVAPGTKLVVSSPIPGTVIHYTTDGWTPTEDSLIYAGPITIDNDMRVQAFDLEPGMLPSPIVDATFIVKPRQTPKPKVLLLDDNILHKGAALRLVTGIDARSDSAQVGDTLLLKLDENVMLGDQILAAKGSLGKATITAVEKAGRGGKPGSISFKVESLEVSGTTVPLQAKLTLAAPDIAAQAARISNPNAVHITGVLPKGDEAAIEPGMPLTAIVVEDTPLH